MEPALLLVRHGRAEPKSDRGDAHRRLTPEGREAFEALARRLAPRLGLRRILASPYRRARETADLLAAATGAPVEEDHRLESGASSGRELLELGRSLGPGVALVGHNPELAEAVSLAAGSGRELPPGAVAAVEARGRLAWLELPP